MLKKISYTAGYLDALIWIGALIAELSGVSHSLIASVIQVGMGLFVVLFLPSYFLYQYRKDTFPPPISGTAISAILGAGLSVLSVLYATGRFFGGPGFWVAAGFYAISMIFISSVRPGKRDIIMLSIMFISYIASILAYNI